MSTLRVVAWILVAVALMLVGADLVSTLEVGVPVVRTATEVFALAGVSLPQVTEDTNAVLRFFLEVPMWAILGFIGIVLTLVFRPIR